MLAHGGSGAALPVQMPASPTFAGLAFGAQALSLDAAAPWGLGAVSNAVILRVH